VSLLAAWLCIPLQNPLANGKAKISEAWLQGIPCSVNRASGLVKALPAPASRDRCCCRRAHEELWINEERSPACSGQVFS